MRLGGWYSASNLDELENVCQKLDKHGLSTVTAPPSAVEWTEDQCATYGQRARDLDIVIGEWGMWENLMTEDPGLRRQRVHKLQDILAKAEAMKVTCVVTFVGTRDPSDHSLAPHSWMFTDQCKAEFQDVVLGILEGTDLKHTHFVVKPRSNTFFYRPQAIREFIDCVDHPCFGVHLDPASMIDHDSFFKSTQLIHEAFDLLADKAWSVNLKDIHWDFNHTFMKWDAVQAGNGVLDFDTLIKRVSLLPEDTPCLCDHLATEEDYADNFRRLHGLAGQADLAFRRRRV
jgi:sugar phosphate isomerase/epimerase